MSDEIYDEHPLRRRAIRAVAQHRRELAVPHLRRTVESASRLRLPRRLGVVVGRSAGTARDFQPRSTCSAALRLCANVPAQWAIEPALTGPDTIAPLTHRAAGCTRRGKRCIDACAHSRWLRWSRRAARCTRFRRCVGDACARLRRRRVRAGAAGGEGVLVVPGSGFNFRARNHFRITLLPQGERAARGVRAHRAQLARRVRSVEAPTSAVA